jgi:hypothetical protein
MRNPRAAPRSFVGEQIDLQDTFEKIMPLRASDVARNVLTICDGNRSRVLWRTGRRSDRINDFDLCW